MSLVSKIKLFFKDNQTEIIVWILLTKLILGGFSLTVCLGSLVLLFTLQALKVIEYLYPKRPDIFNELSLIQDQIKTLTIKNEELERDVTGLRMGAQFKR